MNGEIHSKVIESVLRHPVVSDLRHRDGSVKAIVLRYVEDQVRYLERRCDYISSDPCARFPGCLCGQQITDNVLLDIKGNIDPPPARKPVQPAPRTPPPRSTPPRKQPAVTMPVPRKLEFTDVRGDAWAGDRRVKAK